MIEGLLKVKSGILTILPTCFLIKHKSYGISMANVEAPI